MRNVQEIQLLTAASELLSNMLKYGGGGTVQIKVLRLKWAVEVVFSDTGEDIADIEWAMSRGQSPGKTLGIGLPGAKQLSDTFQI